MALRHFGILLPLVLASLTTAAPKPLNPQPEIPKKFGHTKIYRPLARRDEPPENENGTSPWVIPLQWHPGCDHWRDEDCHDRCHHHCCHCWTWEEPCCGNGVIDPGEECDLGPWNGFPDSGCSLDCKNVTLPPNVCGDGIIGPGEECDDGDWNGTPFSNCTEECKIVIDIPPCDDNCCGNGVLNPGEECDDGPRNGQADSKCTTDCKWKEGCCPETCNPIVGMNECDKDTTSCIWIPGAPGPSLKYMCACAAGFRADEDLNNTNKQIRLPYIGLQDRVFVAPNTPCNIDCSQSGDCNDIPIGEMCFENDP